jgi:hypothetical protein
MVNEGVALLRAAASDDNMDFQALKDVVWFLFFQISGFEAESLT